jgi:hypothetical protein
VTFVQMIINCSLICHAAVIVVMGVLIESRYANIVKRLMNFIKIPSELTSGPASSTAGGTT